MSFDIFTLMVTECNCNCDCDCNFDHDQKYTGLSLFLHDSVIVTASVTEISMTCYCVSVPLTVAIHDCV